MRHITVLGMILVLAGSCGEASDRGSDERRVDEVVAELEAVVGRPLYAEGDVLAVAFRAPKLMDTQVRSAFGTLRSDETEDERLRLWAARLLGARRAAREAPDVE